MGVLGQIWGAVKAGIILLLATRTASKLSSSGEFVAYFIALLALLLLIWALQHEFLASLPAPLTQFDSLREAVMTLAQLIIYYFSYVLAAEITEWFEKSFMNGPYVVEVMAVVLMVIFLMTVAGLRFARYSAPRESDVQHLGKISDIAVAEHSAIRPTSRPTARS